MPPKTYLSSWELAAMRDLRVLSATGHPDTLQRGEEGERYSTDVDESTHGCPGCVLYIQFWVAKNWKELTGIGSGFTVNEHGLKGISVICSKLRFALSNGELQSNVNSGISNDQQSTLTAAPVSDKSFSFKPLTKGQQMPSARKQKREPHPAQPHQHLYLFRIRDATSTSERPLGFPCFNARWGESLPWALSWFVKRTRSLFWTRIMTSISKSLKNKIIPNPTNPLSTS